DVRALVDRLVILFLLEGSVNGVQRTLNQVLASDRTEGWLYPNRLHALLSDDPGRAVNDQTLQTMQIALDRIADDLNIEEARRRSAELQAKVLAAWHEASSRTREGGRPGVGDLAAQFEIPPAVVRWILDEAGLLGERSHQMSPRRAVAERREADWSFQDDAYQSTLQALRKDPNRKVGLVIPTG